MEGVDGGSIYVLCVKLDSATTPSTRHASFRLSKIAYVVVSTRDSDRVT